MAAADLAELTHFHFTLGGRSTEDSGGVVVGHTAIGLCGRGRERGGEAAEGKKVLSVRSIDR